jgi:hypothetical protein
LVLVVIDKTAHSIKGVFKLSHVAPGATVAIYQLTNAGASPRLTGTQTIAEPDKFSYTMPAYSVSTLDVRMP